MKLKASCLLISLAVLSTSVMAADKKAPRHNYKCHFILADGGQTVRYMTSSIKSANQFRQSLDKVLYAKDGVTKIIVESITECVKADKTFNGFEARQMDKKTLS